MVAPLNAPRGRAAVPIRNLNVAAKPGTSVTDFPTPAEENEIGFNFHAETLLGRELNYYINVPDPKQALAELSHAGVRVLDLNPRKSLRRKRAHLPKRVELAQLAEQIGDQVESGEAMPAVCALLGRNAKNPLLGGALVAAAGEIMQGKSSAEAFAMQATDAGEPIFPLTMLHGLKIAEETGAIKDPETGESRGSMQVMMQQFADAQMKADQIVSQIRGALMYPAGLIGVTLVIVTVMLYFVVPKLTEMYVSISPDALLPLPTRIIVAISNFLFTLMGVATMGVLVAGAISFVKWVRSPVGSDWIARRALFWPIFGPLLREMNATMVLRNIAMLSSGEGDLTAILSGAAKAATNPLYREMLEDVLNSFQEQSTTFDVLFRPYAKLMGDEFHTVLLTYEKTGVLDKLCIRYARVLEKRVDRKLKVLTSIMETYLIVPVGAFIGGVVIAMYMPLFDMLGKMAK